VNSTINNMLVLRCFYLIASHEKLTPIAGWRVYLVGREELLSH